VLPRVAGALAVGLVLASSDTPAQSPAPVPQVEAGLGRGVTIRSTDGQTSLNIRARIQIRGTVSGASDDEQSATSEISVRRMRLVFQGNASGPTLTYYVQLAFANLDTEADLRLPLRDAYVTWVPARAVNLRAGQMKVPFSRQRVVSSSALQIVDRSVVVSELNLDRDVGLQMFSRDLLGTGRLGYSLGIFGGEGRNRLGRAAGLLYAARIEVWPTGAFDDSVESDFQRGPQWRAALGASVGYNQNTNRPRSTTGTPLPAGDFDYTHAGIDATVRKHGWSLTSELMYRRADRDALALVVGGAPVTVRSRSGWGAYVQGGRMVTSRVELAARYGRLQRSPGADADFLTVREIGAGAGYFVAGNNLKIQGDYFRLTEPAAAGPVHQMRVQFQLFF
jgi:hypothetical protein